MEPSQTKDVRMDDGGEKRNGASIEADGISSSREQASEPAAKRQKTDHSATVDGESRQQAPRERLKGVAPIKPEYIIIAPGQSTGPSEDVDDDAAEAEGRTVDRDAGRDGAGKGREKGRKKQKGQNKEREFGRFDDMIKLCNSVAFTSELSPKECKYGDRCKLSHDVRRYLKEGRRPDLDTFDGNCVVFETYGYCPAGWKCHWVSSHSEEVEREDGKKELVLLRKSDPAAQNGAEGEDEKPDVVNIVPPETKIALSKKRVAFDKSDEYLQWLDKEAKAASKWNNMRKDAGDGDVQDARAQFVDPPFKPSEKRRLYFGRETPVLAPLTTQGNLPFRRLCVELGCQGTYSEMAMSMPLVQGQKPEWALMKTHRAELEPPRYLPGTPSPAGYDNSRDLKWGAQISSTAAWTAVKATEALTRFLPHIRLVDINCGCPIDMVFKSGAGSALLDAPAKLERIIRGMNAVSGEIPITAKLRTGVRDGKPNANKVIERLAFGGPDTRERLGGPGCAAVTLHGRSRQQRYTKVADWGYIAECAALIKSYHQTKDDLTDTIREPDESTLANKLDGRLYFLGNGDCYSHIDYLDHVENAKVDTVMVGRGALIKPWLFEEIEKGQYLDKSASERLAYIEKFVRYGLESWGTDELGIGWTRRFLLEWLSFSCRYVPIGILEHLPPNLNDRPPAWRGRNDLETLLASKNYKDWLKISEMFLGPAHPGFQFQPKHKSNSYEIDAEG